jgi:hypothetical protein
LMRRAVVTRGKMCLVSKSDEMDVYERRYTRECVQFEDDRTAAQVCPEPGRCSLVAG